MEIMVKVECVGFVKGMVKTNCNIRFEIWSIFITEECNCFPRSASSSSPTNSMNVRLNSLREIWISAISSEWRRKGLTIINNNFNPPKIHPPSKYLGNNKYPNFPIPKLFNSLIPPSSSDFPMYQPNPNAFHFQVI